MKSKKAQEYIINNLLIVKGSQELLISPVTAASAVEQAETDRDAKAVEAHRTSCESYYNGGCCGPHEPCTAECSYMKKFIQKLNEE